jgi:light-regulated signal transduction histidine kinase (bacteriophytochrome)
MGSLGRQTTKPSWLADSETVREFLTIAVHDLREPLRAIRSSSELLAEMHGDSTSENETRCLRFISEGVDRMESLIHDVAEYCYQELQELDPTETDLQRVLAEVQRQLSDELMKNEAVLTHDPLPVVMGDFLGLATVFRCLIANACKFRGKAAPNIRVGAIQQGPEWFFSIQDNGIGFNPAYQDRVFDPFQRLNGKQYPGSGLGLPLAKRIIEQHGGRMWAESQPGQGSTFRFTLPVAE